LSLAGIAPLAGFWSKDEILLAVLDGRNPIFLAVTLVIVFFSALYMARVYFVVFTGETNRDTERAHESPRVMVLPLAVLATGAALVGFMALNVGGYDGFASFLTFGEHRFEINIFITLVSVLLAFGGFGLGYAIYARKAISTENLVQRYNPLHRLLVNKYYLDNIYQWAIDRVVLVFSNFVAAFDRIVVNDGAVNGVANTIRNSGFRIRYLETGLLYNYALGMVLGVMAVSLFWWLVIPRIV